MYMLKVAEFYCWLEINRERERKKATEVRMKNKTEPNQTKQESRAEHSKKKRTIIKTHIISFCIRINSVKFLC